MLPKNLEYLVVGALIGVYFLLKSNFFPKVSATVRPRVFLLVIFCILSLGNLYAYHKEVLRYPYDPVTSIDNSLRELRTALPAQGVVGFISDVEDLDTRDTSLQRYFVAQYAIAPVVLVEGTRHQPVIGYFDNFNPKLVPDDLVLVRDYGQGLLLFEKRTD